MDDSAYTLRIEGKAVVCQSQHDLQYDCPDGSLITSAMIQIYATVIITVMNQLQSLEASAKTWDQSSPGDEVGKKVNILLVETAKNCASLKLRSAWKQLNRLHDRVQSGTCRNDEFSLLIAELRTRICEDLEDRAFYCVVDTDKIDRFYKRDKEQPTYLIVKHPQESFDPIISERFADAVEDLERASRSYIFGLYTGCVFHLMRVVEYGLKEVAKLADVNDPKASWGAVLSTVDKYAFRTEHKDLPDKVKPHRELLRELSPEMHAIQHAWRNRVSHVENKLIPAKPFDKPIASEIMTAVQAFMRSLAERLPPI